MQAITSPNPERPVSPTPPPLASDRRQSIMSMWLPIAMALLMGTIAGYLFNRPGHVAVDAPVTTSVANLHSAISWMFDAALTHDAIDQDGTPVAAAVPAISVESVNVFDPVIGPIVAVVASPTIGLTVYEISVTRDELDWQVSARRIVNDDLRDR